MSVELSTLSNGLTVASLTMAGAHSVNVGIWIKAGGRDEMASEDEAAFSARYCGRGRISRWLYECAYGT